MEASTKKLQVQNLRKQGMSFGEIASALGVQKNGLLSKWCEEVELAPFQIKNLKERELEGTRKGRIESAKKLHTVKWQSKEKLRQEGVADIGTLDQRDLLICGIAMYWSEGYTYAGGEQVGFTNSDPQMILLMLRWFREICGISPERFSLHIKIHEEHKVRMKAIETYWSNVTDIPFSQFTRTTFIKTTLKKIYPNPELYNGTLRITIRRGSLLRRKIHGWIEGLAHNTKNQLPA